MCVYMCFGKKVDRVMGGGERRGEQGEGVYKFWQGQME